MRKVPLIVSRLIGSLPRADIQLLRNSDLMDPIWYKSNYPDLRDLKEDAAVHYLRSGAAERRNPSAAFDTAFYLSTYPDVAAAKLNPLVHYLRQGVAEGRRASADQIVSGAVEAEAIFCVKAVELQPRMALVTARAPAGRLAVHVAGYVEGLAASGVSPVLIVVTDEAFIDEESRLAATVSGLYVRSDDGQDFSAWAHVVKLNPALLDVELLVLTNDRLVGPIDDEAFRTIIDHVRSADADFLGFTDNYAVEWHVEPYFLALKASVLRSRMFREYLDTLRSLKDISLVFAEHLLPLMRLLAHERSKTEVMFPSKTGETARKTLTDWRELISQGFPFLDTAVIQEARGNPQLSDWRMVVSAYGFDPSVADPVPGKADRRGRVPTTRIKAPAAVRISMARSFRKKEAVFSPEFYLHLYSDVSEAGWDPLHHFIMYGQTEGRIGALTGSERLSEFSASPHRETVLVVSHDGSRTGCPILSYNLCKELAKRYNVIALFLQDGPMIASFRAADIVSIGPVMSDSTPDIIEKVVSYIQRITPLRFAITNSIESRHILPALAREYVPTVSLIHEFSAYTRSSTAFHDAVRWAGETVFSSPVTRDDAIRSRPSLAAREFPIVAQGRCLPPPASSVADTTSGLGDTGELERARVRRALRPEGFPQHGIAIIGIGTVQMRKGVDLFLDCAARIKAACLDTPIRFVWVGHGYHPTIDFEYSAYLADQVERADLAECMEFLGETTEMLEVYAQANLLLLTSRLDPLPNVAIEAMGSGVPVACFARTTGIADILLSERLGEDLVADYLDVDSMARKVSAIVQAPVRLATLRDRVREVSLKTFNMERYVLRLEELAIQTASRAERERADVDIILKHGQLIRFDYSLPPDRQDKRSRELVREYVRSWASEVDMRKLMPGFHPGIYKLCHATQLAGDPLADYLVRGRPEGPWSYPLITPTRRFTPAPRGLRVGLHIHVHYPELLPEIMARLKRNKVRPELLLSMTTSGSEAQVRRLLRDYPSDVDLRVTPNRGRDIGALFTEFGRDLQTRFDVIGHIHTKKTADIENADIGRSWYRFLLENLLGGKAPMADIILGRMSKEPRLGLVLADDPHVVGWDANQRFVEPYVERLSLGPLPRYMHVPVGTMFWARPEALAKMFELRLGWDDYPAEPLPYDGSLLHGLERLFGLVAENAGFGVAGVNCPGVTR